MAKYTIRVSVCDGEVDFLIFQYHASTVEEIENRKHLVTDALRNNEICREAINEGLYNATCSDILDKFGHELDLPVIGHQISTKNMIRGIIAYYEDNPEVHDQLFTDYMQNIILPTIFSYVKRGLTFAMKSEKERRTSCGGYGNPSFSITLIEN